MKFRVSTSSDGQNIIVVVSDPDFHQDVEYPPGESGRFRTQTTCDEVTISIDANFLIAELTAKAFSNKLGVAKAYHGAISARAEGRKVSKTREELVTGTDGTARWISVI